MKGPCPDCPSSDGFETYDDGHGHCFVCGHHTTIERTPTIAGNLIPLSEQTFQALTKRRINEETTQHWKYGTSTYSGHAVQVANYMDTGGKLIAQKIRFPDKKFLILGDADKMGLYGAHLWRDGGRKVVVTEGEVDALSVSQQQGNKWPVVSVPNGSKAAKKALAANLEWLEKFDEVILMFDQDEPGRESVAECSELFTPGKCKVASLPLKDASDMLQAGRGDEIINAIWGAKEIRPDGIVSGAELWEEINTTKSFDALPMPYEGLDRMIEGHRLGEVLTIMAGSGIGKSEVVRQIYYHWLMKHDEKLGLIHLEEPVERTSLGMMGLYLHKRLNRRDGAAATTEEERKNAFDATVGNGNVYLYKHFGSTDSDNLVSKIRYFVKGLGCKTIVLDHVSMVISGIEDGDERRMLDNLMTKLSTLAQELHCRILCICHLKRKQEGSYNEGATVALSDARGSAAIEQLSHTVIALERNQQDEVKKWWTRVVVLKCRETGETGLACWLKYDPVTGWLTEAKPKFKSTDEASDDSADSPF